MTGERNEWKELAHVWFSPKHCTPLTLAQAAATTICFSKASEVFWVSRNKEYVNCVRRFETQCSYPKAHIHSLELLARTRSFTKLYSSCSIASFVATKFLSAV